MSYSEDEIEKLLSRIEYLEREIKKYEDQCHKLRQSYDLQYKELNDNVEYAKFIQRAFLPTVDEIKLSFPESFLIYLPKNRIGGDFYFHHHDPSHEYIIFAVGDATGHGIPGALLSMLGLSMLNEIVRYQLTLNPALILELMRLNLKFIFRRLTTTFRPTTLDELFETYLFDFITFVTESIRYLFTKINPFTFKWQNIKDLFSFSSYMRAVLDKRLEYQIDRQSALYQLIDIDRDYSFSFDISLALFYPKKKKLYYSGANLSLLIIREGQLFELKGVRNPIGFYFEEKKFETQEFDLRPGDVVYFFSDGYKDQIGGENQKFSSKRFKHLLTEVSGLTMDGQKEALYSYFRFWKGDYEQTDDITVAGIRWSDEVYS